MSKSDGASRAKLLRIVEMAMNTRQTRAPSHTHCIAGAEKTHDLRVTEQAEAGKRVERLNRGLVPRLDRGGRVVPGLQARTARSDTRTAFRLTHNPLVRSSVTVFFMPGLKAPTGREFAKFAPIDADSR
jgi:hypothetical protein